MKSILRLILKKIFSQYFLQFNEEIQKNRMLMAKLLIRQVRETKKIDGFRDVEFKAFSQNGEDGIIQYLLHKVPIENEVFIEFGVSNYQESNTRFLLLNDNWKGLVIDGSAENIQSIKRDPIYWKHEITAQSHFITKSNINSIIAEAGVSGDIGLLSVDVDGNDYWVWEAIDVIQPRIVISEYNSIFGDHQPISVPYDENFVRTQAHHSGLFFGASLPALCLLAEKKGYDFVGSDSSGINAFFVRSDLDHELACLSAQDGYVASRHREARDQNGRLTYTSGGDRYGLIEAMEVINVENNQIVRLGDAVTVGGK